MYFYMLMFLMSLCLSDMGKGQECINIFVFQSNTGFVHCLLQYF